MTISSRTPEGDDNSCPICGRDVCLAPSQPSGDAPCPYCGHLLWWFQQRISLNRGIPLDQVELLTSLEVESDLAADSLDVVELLMEIEEEFEITIPDDDYEKILTVGEAIRYIESARRLPRDWKTGTLTHAARRHLCDWLMP